MRMAIASHSNLPGLSLSTSHWILVVDGKEVAGSDNEAVGCDNGNDLFYSYLLQPKTF